LGVAIDAEASLPAPELVLEDDRRKGKARRAAKSLFDLTASLVAFLVMLPFLLILAALIVIDSRGPVFYVQRRVGRAGKDFRIFKFRTMVRDADDVLLEHLKRNPDRLTEWVETRKLRNDPRITRFGRFLRKYSLDELPQILNVLKGDMSLVGPRPVVRDEVRLFGDLADDILSVKPGLTGLWAVSGRNDVSYSERLALEYWYVKSWRFVLDLSILLRTVPAVLRGRGAY
jgi:Undecaprenyl-phosphate galactose phosphotransferase WbaP